MKIAFAGGGTAGHINPSIALAEELVSRGHEVFFISREGGGENSLITDRHYPLYTIRVCGLRKTPSGFIKAVRLAKSATKQAETILNTEKPDALLATGGYVSYPALKAAIKLKIPALIHESNAKKGLVTKMLGKKCNLVMLPLSYADKLSKNEIKVATPVKKGFSSVNRQRARRSMSVNDNDILILSLGGSLGARALNDTVISCIQTLHKKYPNLKWIHSTGNRYYSEIIEKHGWLNKSATAKILPYINDMPRHLCSADIVISRCGAVTLAEILEAKVPAILIPSPNVSGDHQRKNAESLMPIGSSIIIDERQLSYDTLCRTLDALISDADKRKKMRTAYETKKKENPREKICKIITSFRKE